MSRTILNEIDYFNKTLKLANHAITKSEIPIGAVIVKDGKIIAHAFNETEKRKNFTAHAEMIAIQKACRKLKTKFLNDCTLYVSLEPCPMCRAAAQLSRLKSVHYLLKSEKYGAKGKALFKTEFRKYKPGEPERFMVETVSILMGSFFKDLRK